MKSSDAWRKVIAVTNAWQTSPFTRGVIRDVVSRILDQEESIVLITQDEFKAAMLRSFLEGQKFARENSLEGTLAKAAHEMEQAGRQLGRLPGPKSRPPFLPPGTPIVYHTPSSRSALRSQEFKKIARKMLEQQEDRQMRARVRRR